MNDDTTASRREQLHRELDSMTKLNRSGPPPIATAEDLRAAMPPLPELTEPADPIHLAFPGAYAVQIVAAPPGAVDGDKVDAFVMPIVGWTQDRRALVLNPGDGNLDTVEEAIAGISAERPGWTVEPRQASLVALNSAPPRASSSLVIPN